MEVIVISISDLISVIRSTVEEALDKKSGTANQSPTKPLSIDEAAKYLGIPKNTLYQLTSSRGIPHQKLGRRLTFLTHQLDDWILSRKRRTRQEIEEEVVTYTRKGAKK